MGRRGLALVTAMMAVLILYGLVTALLVQVRQDQVTGVEQAGRAVRHHVRRAVGVIDDDAVKLLIGEDEVGG